MKRTLILLLFGLSSLLYAQDEDMLLFDTEEEQEETQCVPEDLTVPYEKFANTAEGETQVRQWYSFGSEHHKNQNYRAGLTYLWKVFFNDSTRYAELAIGKVAEAYFYLQNADSSLIASYLGLERYPDQQKLHYYAGYLQEKLGRGSCAIPHYEALVNANPQQKSYLSTLARLYYKEGDERCIDMQQRVVDLDPSDSQASGALAEMITQIRGEGAALEIRESTWRNEPDNLSYALAFAREAVNAGSYKKSLEPLNKIISTEPSAEAFRLRARAYENMSQYSNAVQDYEGVLNFEKDNADVMLEISKNYVYAKQFKSADAWINRALSARSGYGKAYIARGEMIESLVSYCQDQRGDGKLSLQDKMAYEIAQSQYRRAQQDLGFKAQAESKFNNLAGFIRTAEDKFMEPNAKIDDTCYSWIVKY